MGLISAQGTGIEKDVCYFVEFYSGTETKSVKTACNIFNLDFWKTLDAVYVFYFVKQCLVEA